jgi:predicted PurR-regulated permease PerM
MKLRTLENRAFLLVVVIITIALFWLLRPFMLPLFWAVVLAVLFQGVYRGWRQLMPGWRNTAALLTLLTAILIAIVPLALIGVALTNEVIGLYAQLTAGDVDVVAPLRWIEEQAPLVAGQLERFGIATENVREWITQGAGVVSTFVAQQALALGQNAAQFAVMFGLMLYVLYFFIRDGKRLLNLLVRALPLGDAREHRLFERFVLVARATVKGTLVVAAVQGAIGGVLFWIVGIQAPVLWAVVMAILALLPVVGTVLVWGPAAIYLFSVGQIGSAIFLVIGGAFVVGLADNFLRPILIGRDARMPDWLVLVSTLGGLVKFGLTGFVAGPMLAAFFMVAWEIFAEEFSTLDSPGTDPDLEPDPDVRGPGDPPLGAEDATPEEPVAVPISEGPEA